MSKGTFILFLWLIIGAAAAGQRGYFSAPNLGCTQGPTMALTIVAGPLNYVGLNPKISCRTPKPCGACPAFRHAPGPYGKNNDPERTVFLLPLTPACLTGG